MSDFNPETMSDDEILNFDYAAFDDIPAESDEQDTATDENPEVPADLPKEEEDSEQELDQAASEDTDEENNEDTDLDQSTEEHPEDSEEKEGEDEESLDSEEENQEEADKKPEEETNYKGIVDELFATFRANGRDMQVKNVDEARRLMSMGANYNKKMQALNPHLKLIKTLEKNDLLDENKLNFLIDLDKKNPEAINKLLRDSEIDPLEINLDETDGKYQPGNHSASDNEVALDQVLEELQSTPTFAKTVNEVTKVWDSKSRSLINQQPEALRIINDHVANGIYDQVMGEVQRRQALGMLQPGLSDFEAYHAVGNEMHSSGAFNQEPPAQEQHVTPPEQVAKKNTEVRKRKQVASATRGRRAKKPSLADYDPLNMSDEEIMKVTEQFGIR